LSKEEMMKTTRLLVLTIWLTAAACLAQSDSAPGWLKEITGIRMGTVGLDNEGNITAASQ